MRVKVNKRTVHSRPLTGIHSTKAASARALSAIHSPEYPAYCDLGSTEVRRRYKERRAGAVRSMYVVGSCILVFETHQTSIFKLSIVSASAACWPVCMRVRTLKAPRCIDERGLNIRVS